MKRIDSRTVELLPGEQDVQRSFDLSLDQGMGIKEAADWVLPRFGPRSLNRAPRWISAEFVEYLSDSTLTVISGLYADKVQS